MADKEPEYIVPGSPKGTTAELGNPKSSVGKKKVFAAVMVMLLVGAGVASRQFWPSLFGTEKKEVKPEITINEPPQAPVYIDSDNDGLNEKEEIMSKTDPENPDSDRDGLADGDEVRIYSSNPLKADTDGDGFEDGKEVARSYSPVSTSAAKANAVEVQKWTTSITRFLLHEPTKTTLLLLAGSSSGGTTVEENKVYRNQKNRFEIKFPPMFASREQNDGQEVGIYVSGAETDEDVDTDPMFFQTAVKVEGQELKDWIDSLYLTRGYQDLVELKIGDIQAMRISLTEDNCTQKLTFFSNGTSVIIFTLNCSASLELEKYYEEIALTFKFI